MYTVLFYTGGLLYYLAEILYRGHSHVSMFILGGICFILVGKLNEGFLEWDTPLLVQGLIESVIITTLELGTGIVVNLYLGLNVWNYSDRPYNLLGQICLEYSLLWVVVSILAILLDDYVRYKCYDEEKPRYKIL